jgi:hypothetical protein
MSTPPPHPGPAAALARQAPADAPAGPPEPRGAKFGTHQVLWGLGGLIVGLATGILGTAAESPFPAAAASVPVSSAAPSATAGAATAAHRAATGTMMAGDGLFRIGPDLKAGNIRAGTWRTAGAVGGAAGSCYVALLHRPGASSVISSQIVTGPAIITTTRRTRAIRTSGCEPWHRVSAAGAGVPAADVPAGGGWVSTQNDGAAP